jgi:polysaccharide biosynthesis protein PelA
MPLNYLGVAVRFHDIAWGIPLQEELDDVFAILCWCEGEKSINASELCRWLTGQAQQGIRLLILGNLPFLKDSITGLLTSDSLIDDLFRAIGLAYGGQQTANPLLLRIDWQDPEMMGFERPLAVEDLEYYALVQTSSSVSQPYLIISRSDMQESGSIAVATTANGAYALTQTALYVEPIFALYRWVINPFLFFERALGLERRPRFDTCTLFGRRIFYSQIDGDGFRNLSHAQPDVISGQVILDEIIRKYPLPVTASFITVEVNPSYMGTKEEPVIAKAIFQEPNVECGAHGFTHPLDWARGITVFTVRGYSREIDPVSAEGANELGESGYTQGAQITVPKAEWLYDETVGSCNYLTETLCPKDKPVTLYQWTGNCRPPSEAIRLVRDAGLSDINGGDGRLDRAYPTYTKVAPLTRTIANQRQVYASNANEDIYTNGWAGPYYGQMYVVETYQQTEIPTLIDSVPRRVAPMNLYYHYYSGERSESLYALHFVLDYIMKTPCIPVFTSRYSQGVRGFFSGVVEELGENGWHFSNYGACQTVRFDQEPLWPDLDRSSGILGYVRWNDSLYVHLSEVGEATLYLSEVETELPYLAEASAIVKKLQVSQQQITMEAEGVITSVFKFANMRPSTDYAVKIDGSSTSTTARSSDDGTLEVSVPVQGKVTLEINSSEDLSSQ